MTQPTANPPMRLTERWTGEVPLNPGRHPRALEPYYIINPLWRPTHACEFLL